MLQQTQAATVVPYFVRWMEKFPDWAALAAAKEMDVLKAWEGLGYYRRAKLLHALARHVINLPEKELPADPEALQTLPGIGPYTAGAIASIAFNVPAPAVDGNVERVLARLINEPGDFSRAKTRQRMAALASAFLQRERASDFTQALMELGALICLPRNPLCALCPVCNLCARPDPNRVPRKNRTVPARQTETLAWIVDQKNQVLLRRPGTGPRWPDFWKLPFWLPNAMKPSNHPQPVHLTYGITRYRVTATLRPGSWQGIASGELEKVPLAELDRLLLPAPHRKLIQLILEPKTRPA